MNRLLVALLSSLALAQAGAQGSVPVAGSTTVEIGSVQLVDVALGLSARKQILGHLVVNGQGDTVGKVDDLVVAPDRSVTYAIVGVGGFLGVKRHHVAIPVDEFTPQNDIFLLAGATREIIKSMPAFDYVEP
jgi:sporulation protein YlmC with PRC-barrel domain